MFGTCLGHVLGPAEGVQALVHRLAIHDLFHIVKDRHKDPSKKNDGANIDHLEFVHSGDPKISTISPSIPQLVDKPKKKTQSKSRSLQWKQTHQSPTSHNVPTAARRATWPRSPSAQRRPSESWARRWQKPTWLSHLLWQNETYALGSINKSSKEV